MTKRQKRLTIKHFTNKIYDKNDCKITKKIIGGVISDFVKEFSKSIMEEKESIFSDLGTFYTYRREPKRVMNPKTREYMMSPKRIVVRFHVGKRLKRLLNNKIENDTEEA